MTDPTVKSIGRQAFLSVCILATEVLVILKLSEGEFTKPMEPFNYNLMLVCIAAYLAFCAWGVWYIVTNNPATSPVDEIRETLQHVDNAAAPLRPKVDEQVMLVAAARVVSEKAKGESTTKNEPEVDPEAIVDAVVSPRSRRAAPGDSDQPTNRRASRSRARA